MNFFRLLILFLTTYSVVGDDSELPECRPHNFKLASPFKGKWYLLPDGSMRFENDRCKLRRFEYAEVAKCMKKSHLVMMGASVTRYLYLTLISLLTHGQWPQKFTKQQHPELPPSIIWEHDFKDYFSFYEESSHVVTKEPTSYEICDCYRQTFVKWDTALKDLQEARYYRHIPNGDLNDLENDIRISYLPFSGLKEVPVRGHKELAFYPRDESFHGYVRDINQRYCKGNKTVETLIPYMQDCGIRRSENKNNVETWDFPLFSEASLPDCDQIYTKPDTNECQRFEREIFQGLNATHVMLNMGWHRSLRSQHPLFLEKLVDAGKKYLKPLNSTTLKLGKVIWRSCTYDEKYEEGEELVREFRHRHDISHDNFDLFNVNQLTARLKQYSKARKDGLGNVLDFFTPHPTLFPKELISKITSKEITYVSPCIDGIHFEPYVNSEIWNIFFNSVCE